MWSLSYTWFKPSADLGCYTSPEPEGCETLSCPSSMGSSPWQRRCRWNYSTNCCPVAWRASFAVQKSPSCPYQIITIQVIVSMPSSRVANTAGAPGQDKNHQSSEGSVKGGSKTDFLSFLSALGKSKKWEWRCTQQLEGRLIFPLKLGNHFLAAAVTARVPNRSG